MDFKEAMQKRHMVRKYTDKPLSDEIIARRSCKQDICL